MWSVAIEHNGCALDVYDDIEFKEDAIKCAKELGGAYVVKGNQRYNKPIGNTEDSYDAWHAYYE